MILALDPGTKFGWAIGDDEKIISCGTWDLTCKGQQPGYKFCRLFTHLESLNPHLWTVSYELVARHLGTRAAHLYGAFQAVIQMVALDYACQMRPVPVGTWKKATCGKGNADHDEYTARARQRWPELPIADDNAAAACLIWLWTTQENPHGDIENGRS